MISLQKFLYHFCQGISEHAQKAKGSGNTLVPHIVLSFSCKFGNCPLTHLALLLPVVSLLLLLGEVVGAPVSLRTAQSARGV